MNPYFVRANTTTVEVWSGQRIQHGNEGRDNWQRALKAELRQNFSRLDIPADALLAGHYNTTSPIVTDTENSLFTNMAETMPRAFTALRFERGAGILPEPPIPIDLTSGHLHYYRYQVGGLWTIWKPDQTLARWVHIPRRLRGDDTARPVWFALRQANANGLVAVSSDDALEPGTNFGVRITVHATKHRLHNPISNSEFVIDGTIAAFHHDQLSDELVATFSPSCPPLLTSNSATPSAALRGRCSRPPRSRFPETATCKSIPPTTGSGWASTPFARTQLAGGPSSPASCSPSADPLH